MVTGAEVGWNESRGLILQDKTEKKAKKGKRQRKQILQQGSALVYANVVACVCSALVQRGRGRDTDRKRERESSKRDRGVLQAPKQLDAAFIKLKYLYILNRQQKGREKHKKKAAKTPTRQPQHTKRVHSICCLAFFRFSLRFSFPFFPTFLSQCIDGPNLFTKFKLLSYSAKTAAAGVAASAPSLPSPLSATVVLQSADYMRILFAWQICENQDTHLPSFNLSALRIRSVGWQH